MSHLKKQFWRFLAVGVSAVITDLSGYYVLLEFLDPNIAKAISFILGSLVAFVLNKYWTFERHLMRYKEVLQFGFLYGITLAVNVLTNRFLLNFTEILFFAFLAATGISAALNFLGQKLWVFK